MPEQATRPPGSTRPECYDADRLPAGRFPVPRTCRPGSLAVVKWI
ncbi:hypothetical protein ANT2_3156 [plant metagenome]|uniref:Uncharacterized protein n=1 Tax=plant metagenome TaxID=1297885 RepID=A0A484TXL9_9ZZZZ